MLTENEAENFLPKGQVTMHGNLNTIKELIKDVNIKEITFKDDFHYAGERIMPGMEVKKLKKHQGLKHFKPKNFKLNLLSSRGPNYIELEIPNLLEESKEICYIPVYPNVVFEKCIHTNQLKAIYFTAVEFAAANPKGGFIKLHIN